MELSLALLTYKDVCPTNMFQLTGNAKRAVLIGPRIRTLVHVVDSERGRLEHI